MIRAIVAGARGFFNTLPTGDLARQRHPLPPVPILQNRMLEMVPTESRALASLKNYQAFAKYRMLLDRTVMPAKIAFWSGGVDRQALLLSRSLTAIAMSRRSVPCKP